MKRDECYEAVVLPLSTKTFGRHGGTKACAGFTIANGKIAPGRARFVMNSNGEHFLCRLISKLLASAGYRVGAILRILSSEIFSSSNDANYDDGPPCFTSDTVVMTCSVEAFSTSI